MADPRKLSDAQRKALIARDLKARRELVKGYGAAWKRIRAKIDRLTAQMEEVRKAGGTVDPSWLLQQWRMQAMERQIASEMAVWIDLAERQITSDQMAAVLAGQKDAADLVRESLGPPPPGATFTPALPVLQTETLVGNLVDGTPLRALLDTLGKDVSTRIRSALIEGVALGKGPREIARKVRRASGMPLARALTIARTETLRVYRTTTSESFKANRDTVTGWTWHSALDKRTCPVCFSMHGTTHGVDETLDTHPNCRCAMVPMTKTWKELGFDGVPETRISVEKGANVFARQSVELQRAVLGPGKFAAYKAGQLSLRETVVETRSKVWGRGRRERSLRDIEGRRVSGKAKEKGWSCGSPCRVAEFRPMTDAERKALKVPPGWNDVRMAKDPKSPLQIIGIDSKGRSQYRYSAEHTAKQSALKFDRVRRFSRELDEKILPAIERDLANGSEEALVLRLIHRTGFRVGSTVNTGAKVQAYGATTLRAEHLTINGDVLHFRFVGKKGVLIDQAIEDAELARHLAPRLAKGGDLFATTDAKVRDYLHANNGAHKVKDFRTWVGTNAALDVIKRLPTPKTLADFKRLRADVGKVVSSKLGNTPTVALESYIDPRVFEIWGAF